MGLQNDSDESAEENEPQKNNQDYEKISFIHQNKESQSIQSHYEEIGGT